MMRFALAGTPNCGKTTLFNAFTGAHQHVGNWAGVTVEKKTGRIRRRGREAEITDLPGAYSLSPYSPDEAAAREFLVHERPDCVICVVDSTAPERGVYLALQILALGRKAVLAMNMADELEKQGRSINLNVVARLVGAPAVSVSAKEGTGLNELLDTAFKTAASPLKTVEFVPEGAPSDEAERAEGLYSYAESVALRALSFAGGNRGYRLDGLFLNRLLALPLFFAMLFVVFAVTFGPVGELMAASVGTLFAYAATAAVRAFSLTHPLLSSFLSECVIVGVGGVLSFAPQIMLLFAFLSIMEDSGYMARAAILMDKPLSRIGLSGKAFIPMVMGFGCTVPAVLAARTLENEKSRKLTLMLLPYMPCGARLPIYALFCRYFFPENTAAVLFCVYAGGVAAACVVGALLSKTVFRASTVPFILELPPYRFPSARSLSLHIWQKLSSFLMRAGTLIFAASAVLWMLKSFSPSLVLTRDYQSSILAHLANLLVPFFRPLGFGEWRAVSSLLAGLAAKEAVVSSLAMLYGTYGELAAVFTPAAAMAYIVFCAFYTPCAAAIATLRREIGGFPSCLGTLILQLLVAYALSFAAYRLFLCVL